MLKLALNINPKRSKMLYSKINFVFENSAYPVELSPFVFFRLDLHCLTYFPFILRLSHWLTRLQATFNL